MKLKLLAPLPVLAIVVVACTPAAPSSGVAGAPRESQERPQRVLTIAVRGEPPVLSQRSLEPVGPSLGSPRYLFNAQLASTDERGVPFPYLADALPQVNTETWRVFPDGRMETTYRLRPNLTWHDGAPLSSEDFVFAWRVWSNPGLPTSTSAPTPLMEEVRALDDRTIVVGWKVLYFEAGELGSKLQPLPSHILREPFASLDPTAFSALQFWSHLYVGLGAYRLDRWEPGAFIEAVAFGGHAFGRPKIDRIKLAFIPDPNTALANVLAGEVHYVGEFILGDDHATILEREWSGNRGGAVLYAPTSFRGGIVQLRPGHAEPPSLLDVRVRRALAHATDKEAANEVLHSGRGVISSTVTSPLAPYYAEIDPLITKYPYDSRRAQQLMEEVGFAKGGDGFFVGRDGTPFRLGVWSSSGTKNEQENAVVVDSLRRSGFDAQMQVIPAAMIRDVEARALIPGLSLRGGLRNFRMRTSSEIPRPETRWIGGNYGGWSNPAYDQEYDAYTRSLELSERVRHIGVMERLVTAELPLIPFWYAGSVTAHLAAVNGPVVRQTEEAGSVYHGVERWEWRS